MAPSTSFGRSTTASEVLGDTDLTGRRAIVTGGGSGLGRETARALAGARAAVTLAVRDTARGARAAAELTAETGNSDIYVAQLDLADPGSAARFAAQWEGPLHMLVNNGGGIVQTLQRTPQGWEQQFAVNHLGHFALTLGLHDALGAADGARVVTVSSSGHLASPVVFDDLHFRFRRYGDALAYGQSKTANILFGVEASRRWANDGITANAAAPGPVLTGFQTNMDPERLRARLGGREPVPGDVPEGWKSAAQGVATFVLLAASPLTSGVTGTYFEDCAPAGLVTEAGDYSHGVAPFALDPANAERLWDVSEQLLRAHLG
jgi:NAD(P)-dependent dehydrogenase (short-subunit alcohol dehydrogenase family)